jgi:hypothetical protein
VLLCLQTDCFVCSITSRKQNVCCCSIYAIVLYVFHF